jgi:imidazolonepropionase-like amidohydrolase
MIPLVLKNCRVFDGHSEELLENRSLVIEGQHIAGITENSETPSGASHVIDVGGKTVMPGLIDAHVHVMAEQVNLTNNDNTSRTAAILFAKDFMESALQRGFTSLRDAGGADFTLVDAVDRDLIKGPRLFCSGYAISQTGGHGDFRDKNQHLYDACACTYVGGISKIADGVDQVRAMVRDQLRLGASQIKLMLSGGVASPSDPIWMLQFSDDEIAAAVDEATRSRTYVMGHAYSAEAIARVVKLGVRTIEHGNLIDHKAARIVKENEAFVVPTLATYWGIQKEGRELGMSDETMRKNDKVLDAGTAALETCQAAGAELGFGTDLLGSLHRYQTEEFVIRSEVMSPVDVLRSATSINAKILNREAELGCIAPGALADVIVIDGNPLEDMKLFTADGENVHIVIKNGRLCKNLSA